MPEFERALASSLTFWRGQGLKVAWLKLPLEQASLIPVAVAAGFRFHHSQDYLMLTLPLQEGAFVPPYAGHYIGAGGAVLNERRELLVVLEQYHIKPAHRLTNFRAGCSSPVRP